MKLKDKVLKVVNEEMKNFPSNRMLYGMIMGTLLCITIDEHITNKNMSKIEKRFNEIDKDLVNLDTRQAINELDNAVLKTRVKKLEKKLKEKEKEDD